MEARARLGPLRGAGLPSGWPGAAIALLGYGSLAGLFAVSQLAKDRTGFADATGLVVAAVLFFASIGAAVVEGTFVDVAFSRRLLTMQREFFNRSTLSNLE